MSESVGRETGAGYEPFEAEALSLAEAGVVYTKAWAVGLVLDLAGYDPDRISWMRWRWSLLAATESFWRRWFGGCLYLAGDKVAR